MLCARFSLNWLSGSEEDFKILPSFNEIDPVVLEKIFLNFVNVFSLFCYNLPLKRGGPLFDQS